MDLLTGGRSFFGVDEFIVNAVVLKPVKSFFASAAVEDAVDLKGHKKLINNFHDIHLYIYTWLVSVLAIAYGGLHLIG
ncbi:hypothetical protein COO91_00866 [Nostoc flagelliforme CCNUN1]|uniref:Uncharacterized protein n=1 Tax=Nostoc flagelliforme CCNUN1 TaxID=2038116 RepID=A0A2K8SHX4_9NOSO|nr:hypothetical protein COO91_00866 [Nostoc flagelliforme CCNUN1]